MFLLGFDTFGLLLMYPDLKSLNRLTAQDIAKGLGLDLGHVDLLDQPRFQVLGQEVVEAHCQLPLLDEQCLLELVVVVLVPVEFVVVVVDGLRGL